MSTRQLRRLQAQKELEKKRPDSGSESEPEQKSEAAHGRRPNLFAALGGVADDDDDEVDDDDDQDVAGKQGGEVVPNLENHNEEPITTTMKTKKKKKKKKKSTKTNKSAEPAAAEDDDEIDRAIEELSLTSIAQAGADDARSPPNQQLNRLLSINTHHLRAINEMRQLFGREAIESADAEEENQGRRGQRAQRQQQVDLETFLREPPHAKKLPEVSLRRNIFVQGREHWPRQSSGGLTMREVRRSDGETEYAYVFDREYDSIQALFFACVQMGDPMRMVHLLKQVPYHVSTLLQVSSVAKQDQNMALAAELCERALFTFGRVTTSAFRHDIQHGRARLDFRRPENRQFWLAGYHYLGSLVRKGTYRTALEWAKLLYAINPQDPYGMRHYLHVLALRAYEGKWLVDFASQLEKIGHHPDHVYLQQSVVLAKLQIDDAQGARETLEAGIRAVPWLYCSLFQELNLDTPPSIWGITPSSDAATFWTKLYTHQAKDLWNSNNQATSLLQSVAKGLDRVDVAASSTDAAAGAVDLGSARLVFLQGQTSLLSAVPRSLLDSQPNYEFDPLPPPEEENIFSGEGTHLPWRERHERSQGRTDELMARMNNLLARRAARAGDTGGGGGGQAAAAAVPRGGAGMLGALADGDEDEDDDEVLALRAADDAELQRDIEAHMNWGERGIVGALMQALGVGGRAAAAADDDDVPDDLPGAWPDEYQTEEEQE